MAGDAGMTRQLSVRMTDGVADDLATVMRTGMTASDAVRTALRLLADAHRCAWDYQDVPDGQPVRVLAAQYALADGTPAPLPAYDAASHAQGAGGEP